DQTGCHNAPQSRSPESYPALTAHRLEETARRPAHSGRSVRWLRAERTLPHPPETKAPGRLLMLRADSRHHRTPGVEPAPPVAIRFSAASPTPQHSLDRKSTRLNSSHVKISYAVFC